MHTESNPYPHLTDFFSAYFHEDWLEDNDDWRDVVRDFLQDNSNVNVREVVQDLNRFLDDFPVDEQLQDALFRRLGCYYHPRSDLGGPNVRSWLKNVADALR